LSVIVDKEEKKEEGETSKLTPADDQEVQSSKSTTPTECCALLPASKEIESAQPQSAKLNRSAERVWLFHVAGIDSFCLAAKS
jgi:hypothetical protein